MYILGEELEGLGTSLASLEWYKKFDNVSHGPLPDKSNLEKPN